MTAKLFEDTDGPNKVRPDMPLVVRRAVMAIVRHWEEDLFVGLRWKKVDWETLVTGGVEGEQTPEEAALAEIEQETGYLSAKVERFLSPLESKFYHGPKRQNRHAHFTVMAFRLANGDRRPLSEEEAATHRPVWLTVEEMDDFDLPPAHRHAWEEYKSSGAFGPS